MKIYTRTGDEGETSLFAGGRVSKNSPRLNAYGTVDELSSNLGLAAALNLNPELAEWVGRVQRDLFIIGADLATPLDADAPYITRLDEAAMERLESEIDQLDTELPPLRDFILPGGTPAAAALHVARTVCRRAEREILTIEDPISPAILPYINRLSDWLFTVARAENLRSGRGDILSKG